MSLFVITINIYLVSLTVLDIVRDDVPSDRKLIIAVVAIVAVFYVIFCLYLVIYLAIGMGATSLNKISVILIYDHVNAFQSFVYL